MTTLPSKSDSDSIRLFVAVLVPEDIRRTVYERGRSIWKNRTDVSVVKEENLHITLKFLGETEAGLVERVAGALAEVAEGEKAFEVTLGGFGAFGSRKRPGVLWAGVRQGADRLKALSRKLERRLTALGFPDENRFKAHVTIGRVRDRGRGQGQPLEPAKSDDEELGTFLVGAISLMKSTLGRGGSVYEELGTFALGPGLDTAAPTRPTLDTAAPTRPTLDTAAPNRPAVDAE